jgi:hypothetical protein
VYSFFIERILKFKKKEFKIKKPGININIYRKPLIINSNQSPVQGANQIEKLELNAMPSPLR